jgi:hypothetical protein
MSTLELKVYEIFKSKLGEKEAETLIEYFDSKSEKKIAEKKDLFATKEDLANLKAELIKWMFIFWIGQLGALVAIIKLLT